MENKRKTLAKLRKCRLSTEGPLQPHPAPAPGSNSQGLGRAAEA